MYRSSFLSRPSATGLRGINVRFTFCSDVLSSKQIDGDAVICERVLRHAIREVIMSKSFKRSVLLGAMLLGLTAGPALAEDVAIVKVPFPFVVQGRMMPAGNYDVRADDQDPAVLTLVGVKGTKAAAVVATIPEYGRGPAGSHAALTFVRHENEYQLSEVWESADYAREVVQR